MNRSTDRLLALAMLVVGVACFAKLYLALGGKPAATTGAGIFGAAGMLSILAGLLFLTGLLPAAARHDPAVPLFGRDARVVPAGRPRLRRIALAVPLLALLAIVADQFGPRHGPAREPAARDVAAAPAEPSVPAPDPMAPAPEAAKPVSPAQEIAAKPPAELVAAPAQPSQPVEPAEPAAPAQPSAPPAEQTALAPDTPPETVAPPQLAPPALPTAPEGHRDAVVWLAVSADGREIISASTDRVIKLWDLDGQRLIRDLGVHKDMARTALFMPDGKTALTAGDDGEIVLRQLSDGAVLHVFSSALNGGVNKLAISPDGKRAVSAHDSTGKVIVWNIERGAALHVSTGYGWPVSAVAVSPDGTRAISGSIDGELKLWDIVSGKLLRSWHGHDRGAYGALFTADGRHAVTGSGDYTIKLWDLDSFTEVRRFDGHSDTVYALALSSDGKRLGSVSLDGTARIWNMNTGAEIAEFDPGTGPIYSVAFAADGTLLTGGIDRTIRDWPAGGGDGVVLFAGAPE
ncbi:WD40 repeat domain-containing protein [Mesorhizobium sp. M1C.F.Ca.ET.193.01.1.1]|uniref:WD40 repeat domain-containing protein n=1 Tax=unclassified Mesorhizobium TaxID=325217 RepID=UPI000FD3F36B|nr:MULTISPECIES: WD40 repeat domain-containing protein [unclassified Mesorhizobium]TGS97292.1 WD40 repeat domain-containing protein [bacterium M00.F.Ca.ET.177.01.1.1]TGQ52463.1 WD40 repeat domain-containing protein [Mesorhizobium sp. M1C.F.Ca.ET.210.01.1.1]TGQ69085.1 WD40 repeat domain-containing protein [Mesorhizobium sp. M1C.F.Ca.ET.212.01.1.1]TGR05101.1 WD40 repeat domain-containing protein [Mesorhizobium sp. M1C.F.Ca.ET.204.01.1.1]TGR25706.1 WD40 repeat domain-containing protein [Mesorhizo